MKRVIIGLVIALASAQSASADGIRSPLGISQAEWNASETYKNFVCPQGTSRGEGVDMNFTTNRSDDFWFVECHPIVVVTEPIRPITPTPAPVITADTGTATISNSTPTPVIAPVSPTETPTVTVTTATETTTVTTTTNTVTSILDEELDLTWDWDKILAWIVAWFETVWIRL